MRNEINSELREALLDTAIRYHYSHGVGRGTPYVVLSNCAHALCKKNDRILEETREKSPVEVALDRLWDLGERWHQRAGHLAGFGIPEFKDCTQPGCAEVRREWGAATTAKGGGS